MPDLTPSEFPRKLNTNEVSSDSNQSAQKTAEPLGSPKYNKNEPLIGFTTLFIGGLFLAMTVIVGSLFFMNISTPSTSSMPSSTQKKVLSPTATVPDQTPKKEATPTKKMTVLIPGWKEYIDTDDDFSFQYPSDHKIIPGEKLEQLTKKISVMSPDSKNPIFTVTTWKSTITPLAKTNVESWCYQTLLDEARKENILCAFFSTAALNDTDVDGEIAYSTNYYNSDQEKVDFYIIPLPSKIITISVITLLDDDRQDNNKSQAKKILQDFKIN